MLQGKGAGYSRTGQEVHTSFSLRDGEVSRSLPLLCTHVAQNKIRSFFSDDLKTEFDLNLPVGVWTYKLYSNNYAVKLESN